MILYSFPSKLFLLYEVKIEETITFRKVDKAERFSLEFLTGISWQFTRISPIIIITSPVADNENQLRRPPPPTLGNQLRRAREPRRCDESLGRCETCKLPATTARNDRIMADRERHNRRPQCQTCPLLRAAKY